MRNYRERNQGNKEPKLFQDDIRKTIGCFFETIGCFYQQFIKNNLKTEFKELRVRDKHANNLYWFTLTPRATSSPQKPLGIPLCNQN